MQEVRIKEKIVKGKYELSLSEFPVTLLSKAKSSRSYIEYRDTIVGKNNEVVERTWRVYPDAKWGFGTPSTFASLYELFQIWKEQEFHSKTITFGSLYSFAKRKGIVPTNTAYSSLKKDLRCLTGLVIEAKNAFWDNEKRAYVDAYFHLFEKVRFYKETPTGQATLNFSYIEASDELFGSVMSNSLLATEFDSAFFHSLKPTEQRLALYLSKMLRNQDVHKRDIVKLAEQLPLTTNLKKKIKQQLKLASQGLIDKGFKLLNRFDFEKSLRGKNENIVFFRQGNLSAGRERGVRPQSTTCERERNPIELQECLVADILEVCGDPESTFFYRKIARVMPKDAVYQAIAEVKEVCDLGTIKKSKGALFTKLIKEKAQKMNLNL
ncbi:MAG: hypothetical protein AB9873_13210 [Syntrophobacteraceae bacterium]